MKNVMSTAVKNEVKAMNISKVEDSISTSDKVKIGICLSLIATLGTLIYMFGESF